MVYFNNSFKQRDLAAISEQVELITKEAERLIGQYPDAQEHIAVKHEQMVQSWNNLVEKAAQRKEKLQQADQLQLYFNDYRELQCVAAIVNSIVQKYSKVFGRKRSERRLRLFFLLFFKIVIDGDLSYMYVWPSLLICYINELIQLITVINAMQIFISH